MLARSLPAFTACKSLYLSNNKIGDKGAEALAAVLRPLEQLEQLE